MNTSAVKLEDIAINVHFDEYSVYFDLADGRMLSAPLVWFPRLLKASPQQRQKWELIGRGSGVHWPEVDEDISVRGLLGLAD